ncbi:MAG: type III pantothenate kinase [Elusimicrobia bacterium]|nr:type III pantothenate kinase [Elusimicrobiota bacterium]
MLLAVDVGNTSLTVGAFAGDRLVRIARIGTDPRRSARSYARALAGAWRGLRAPGAAVYGSVVPPLDRTLEGAVRAAFGLRAERVGPRSPLGLRYAVRAPNQVGADRVLNAVALKALYGGPAIAVDFGTATTFDCLDASGAYAGGAILPGPDLAARSLHEHTAQLPLVAMRRPRRAVGRDTVECLQAGLYFGYLGMIREVLARTKAELGGRPPVVATGGLAPLFLKELPGVRSAPDLTLRGLRLAHQILHNG